MKELAPSPKFAISVYNTYITLLNLSNAKYQDCVSFPECTKKKQISKLFLERKNNKERK